MFKILEYYSRFQRVRGNFGGLPSWARFIVGLLAIPGIVLIVLSILALLVSLTALLLLTVPAYRLLSVLCAGSAPPDQSNAARTAGGVVVTDFVDAEVVEPSQPVQSTRVRPNIEVKIVE